MDHTFISYEEFGVIFFAEAITKDRIRENVADLAGRRIDEGPMSVGPAGIAKVRATGQIAEPQLTQIGKNPITYQLIVPISLDLVVDLHLDKNRFHADVRVPVTLTAHATDELKIVVEAKAPAKADLHVDVTAQDAGAKVLSKIVDIDDEIRSTIVSFVDDELNTPQAKAQRVTDVRENIQSSN